MCDSVCWFVNTITQKERSQSVQTWVQDKLQITWFWGQQVKGQGHEVQNHWSRSSGRRELCTLSSAQSQVYSFIHSFTQNLGQRCNHAAVEVVWLWVWENMQHSGKWTRRCCRCTGISSCVATSHTSRCLTSCRTFCTTTVKMLTCSWSSWTGSSVNILFTL